MPACRWSCRARSRPVTAIPSARRGSGATVFVVVQGRGTADIGEEPVSLDDRAIFVAPSWKPVSIEADSERVLFGYSDRAAQEKLHLYREENA